MENINNDLFLSVKDLVVEYTSGGAVIHAVNGVSFDLKRGHTLGLVGETGAGKTTIAKSIMRVLPDPPAKVRGGQIYLDGQDVLAISENEMRKLRGYKVSMIFQDPMTSLNPVMRVDEQIAEVVLAHNKISEAEAMVRALEMLKMVGISADRAHEYPHQFSGGMKQRVVIAIALACNPELLLADEPTTALDVTIQAQVLELIGELKKNLNMSMIMITHDLGVVAETCDDVAIVYAGEIIESGNIRQIFKNPKHPYTNGLFGALPNMNLNVKRLSPIVGLPPDPSNLPEGCSFAPRCPYASDECRSGSIELKELEKGHFCRCIKTGREVE